jgi:hypothetical protein
LGNGYRKGICFEYTTFKIQDGIAEIIVSFENIGRINTNRIVWNARKIPIVIDRRRVVAVFIFDSVVGKRRRILVFFTTD